MKKIEDHHHRAVYIGLFILLGIQVQFMVHAATEIWYLNYLLEDFGRYGLGLSWQQWALVDQFASWGFLLAGIVIGFVEGKHWWHRLYGRGWRHGPKRPRWLTTPEVSR
jgi:hypothetical protein